MKSSKRKTVLTVFITVLVLLFLSVFIFMTVECHSRILGVKQAPLNHKYASAFSDVDNIVEANPAITELAMLGSHDSVSYGIEKNAKLDGYAKAGLFGETEKLAKGLMYRYAVTQTVNLYEQLMQGARYFHIKVSKDGGIWHGSHSLLAKPLAEDITHILRFLSEYKGEFVILNFQIMYCEGQPFGDLYDFLATVRYDGKNIYDYVHMFEDALPPVKTLTYNDVTSNGNACGAILTSYAEDRTGADYKSEFEKYIYMSNFAIGRWYNSSSKDKLIDGMNGLADYIESLENSRDYVRINQAQSAFSVADADDTLKSLFGQSLLKLASKYNADFINHPSFGRWLSAMPVYQADFVTSTYGGFNDTINRKISDFNKNLCRTLLDNRA